MPVEFHASPVEAWGRLARPRPPVASPAFPDAMIEALRAPGPGPLRAPGPGALRAPGLEALRAPGLEPLPAPGEDLLCFGLGRSYGDVGQNSAGRQIRTTALDRFIAADWTTGVIRAEAGLSLDALLRVAVPRGWFAPVLPGSRFVTLGGAVANDVHGKNHAVRGSFGRHVLRLGLWRPDMGAITLSATEQPTLFAATIGGLGLTGAILWVELRLMPLPSALMESQTLPIADLDGYFALMRDSANWPYRVAWIDCLASGSGIGRGLFTRARPAHAGGLATHRPPRLTMPVEAPAWLLRGATVRGFNWLHRRRPWALGEHRGHYEPFFFPLDAMAGWNRIYGPHGFFQHQSVLPAAEAPAALRALLAECAAAGQASFLVVLKEFGALPSPGLLSFPMQGSTLALDLPNLGDLTRALLRRLGDIAVAAGGRLYPAKDATMTPAQFQAGFPQWEALRAQAAPGFNSDFARRVGLL